MTHYVILGKWTEQGIKNVKDAPKRIDETHKAIEYRGGKMKTPPMPPGGLGGIPPRILNLNLGQKSTWTCKSGHVP